MTVRYVIGRAGMGKTRRVFGEIGEALKSGSGQKLLLIVPEQFTLQAERDLVKCLNLPGIMQIEVLSITRLAHRVFNEAGGVARTLIDTPGKHMVLRKVIDESAGELGVYRKASRQPGFVSMLSDLVGVLKQHDISPQDLESGYGEKRRPALHKKLKDIALIYDRFNAYLKGRYLDTQDYINLLTEKIDQAGLLKGSRVWMDGFTTFNPQTLRVIGKIMALAADTTITFTMDLSGDGREGDLFALSRSALGKLRSIAHSLGLCEEIIDLNIPENLPPKSAEILHIESELFAYPYRRFAGPGDSIEVVEAMNINTEVENAAAKLVSLARDRDYRWKDMAVVCNSLDTYGGLIKRVFEEHGIPAFMDRKRGILNNPIIELVLSVLDIVQRGYRHDDVFRLLKTGFGGLAAGECETIENYCLKYGISGKRWKQEFTLGSADLDELNHCREKFITPLVDFENRVRQKHTFSGITRELYGYLEEIGLQQKLSEWIDELRSRELYEFAAENAQTWNILMGVFDQVVEILGDDQVTLKEYRRVLESGFLSLEVGIIPPTVDSVLVGSIQRSKSHDIKALFVVGVNDGVLPSGGGDEGILSEEEKLCLKQNGIDLESDREIESAKEQLLIYGALTKPSEYLWLSYALADGEGKALRPSVLIDRLRKLFADLKAKSDITASFDRQLELVTTSGGTFKHLVENLRRHCDKKPAADLWWDVYGWYYREPRWEARCNSIIEALFHKNSAEYISAEAAGQLYTRPLRVSVSRLEQFAGCAFAHFIKYGLRPSDREKYEMEAPDIGDLFHKGLLAFAMKIEQNGLSWRDLTEGKCEHMIDAVMDELLTGYGDGVLLSTGRYRYMANRLKRISRRVIRVLVEHVKRGDFEPFAHEAGFGVGRRFPAIEVGLENGERVCLEGRIDRVDLLETEDAAYVKIIDYKSGFADFRLSDVYHGLSLQLMVYLAAVLGAPNMIGREKIKPAGVFYFKIDDPIVRVDEKAAGAVEAELFRKFKMRGLVIKDVKVAQHMDRNLAGWSDIIPAGISKNGEFYKGVPAIEAHGFSALIRHVKSLVRSLCHEMLRGNIKIQPVKNGRYTACGFCSYKSVCQFDTLLEGNGYKNIRQLKDEEVMAKICESEGAAADGDMD